MPDQKEIKITAWPKQKATLEHYFQLDKPCPVSIHFDDKPANLNINNSKERPFHVNMDMNLKAKEDIPVCIKICEPICAVSDYSVGIEFLGQSIANIRLKGKTKIAHCKDDDPVPRMCTNFIGQNPKGAKEPVTIDKIQFTYLGDQTHIGYTTMGAPINQLKMSIPNEGLRLDFPTAVKNVELTIVNFGNPVIQINGFLNSMMVVSQSEMINNTTTSIKIEDKIFSAIEIKGGSNEAALVDVCYERAPINPVP